MRWNPFYPLTQEFDPNNETGFFTRLQKIFYVFRGTTIPLWKVQLGLLDYLLLGIPIALLMLQNLVDKITISLLQDQRAILAFTFSILMLPISLLQWGIDLGQWWASFALTIAFSPLVAVYSVGSYLIQSKSASRRKYSEFEHGFNPYEDMENEPLLQSRIKSNNIPKNSVKLSKEDLQVDEELYSYSSLKELKEDCPGLLSDISKHPDRFECTLESKGHTCKLDIYEKNRDFNNKRNHFFVPMTKTEATEIENLLKIKPGKYS